MNKNNKQSIISMVLWLGIAVAFHLLGWWMKHSAEVYTLYFRWIYLPLAQVKSIIFDWVSFAIGDLVYLAILVLALYLFFKCILTLLKQRGRLRALSRLICFGAIAYAAFLILWGYNYHKPDLVFPKTDKENPQPIVETNLIDDVLLLDSIINRVNDLSVSINWFQHDDEYAAAATKAYHQYHPKFNVDPLKVSLLGRHIYKLGVSGYFNPLTGEGHMIPDLPKASYGFVYLHEMAHQIGVASESEANLVAYMIAMQSDEPIFHYTALLRLYRQLYGRIYLQEAAVARLMGQRLAPEVQQDLTEAKLYAFSHQFSIRQYSMGMYEQYLKQLGHSDGLSAYSKLLQQVIYSQRNQVQLDNILWQYYK